MLKSVSEQLQEKARKAARTLISNPKITFVGLYGSVARGEADRRSDIDLLVIYEGRREKVQEWIDKNLDLKQIHVFLVTEKRLRDQPAVLNDFLKDGITLEAKKSLIIDVTKSFGLKPYYIVVYDLADCDNTTKVKLIKRLSGYKTKTKIRKKEYKYEYEGLIKKLDLKKIGKNVLLVPAQEMKKLEGVFSEFGLLDKLEIQLVWTIG